MTKEEQKTHDDKLKKKSIRKDTRIEIFLGILFIVMMLSALGRCLRGEGLSAFVG